MAEVTEKECVRIVYMGTPGFAATILGRVLQWEHGDVVGVYTQPDRPAGRGRRMRPSEVKQIAQAQNLAVFQPKNFKSDEDLEELRALKPDMILVAAYGLILPQAVLDIPKYGCLNVHASLLPKYRGAAPIQRAILNGDAATGVTIMQMDAGLDTGGMLLQRALGIDINDTASTIHDELAELGGEMLIETMERLVAGTIHPISQNPEQATHAPKLTKDEGLIDWNQPAWEIHNRIRALYPWPGSYFFWKGMDGEKELRLSLTPGILGDDVEEGTEPGTILCLEGEKLAIACADKKYLVPKLVPEGKKPMDARSFCNGYMCVQG